MGNYIIVGLHFCYSRYSNKCVCVYRHTKYRAMNCSIKKKICSEDVDYVLNKIV